MICILYIYCHALLLTVNVWCGVWWTLPISSLVELITIKMSENGRRRRQRRIELWSWTSIRYNASISNPHYLYYAVCLCVSVCIDSNHDVDDNSNNKMSLSLPSARSTVYILFRFTFFAGKQNKKQCDSVEEVKRSKNDGMWTHRIDVNYDHKMHGAWAWWLCMCVCVCVFHSLYHKVSHTTALHTYTQTAQQLLLLFSIATAGAADAQWFEHCSVSSDA